MNPYLPCVTRTPNAGLLQVQKEREEAALVSGASRLRTMWLITARLMIASLVAGWVWVVAHASRAFGTPLVLSGKNNELLSVWLWIHWQDGFIPQAAAIGVVLIVLTAIIGLGAQKLLARTQQRGLGG